MSIWTFDLCYETEQVQRQNWNLYQITPVFPIIIKDIPLKAIWKPSCSENVQIYQIRFYTLGSVHWRQWSVIFMPLLWILGKYLKRYFHRFIWKFQDSDERLMFKILNFYGISVRCFCLQPIPTSSKPWIQPLLNTLENILKGINYPLF